jgi:hypothetical protein
LFNPGRFDECCVNASTCFQEAAHDVDVAAVVGNAEQAFEDIVRYPMLILFSPKLRLPG